MLLYWLKYVLAIQRSNFPIKETNRVSFSKRLRLWSIWNKIWIYVKSSNVISYIVLTNQILQALPELPHYPDWQRPFPKDSKWQIRNRILRWPNFPSFHVCSRETTRKIDDCFMSCFIYHIILWIQLPRDGSRLVWNLRIHKGNKEHNI